MSNIMEIRQNNSNNLQFEYLKLIFSTISSSLPDFKLHYSKNQRRIKWLDMSFPIKAYLEKREFFSSRQEDFSLMNNYISCWKLFLEEKFNSYQIRLKILFKRNNNFTSLMDEIIPENLPTFISRLKAKIIPHQNIGFEIYHNIDHCLSLNFDCKFPVNNFRVSHSFQEEVHKTFKQFLT